MNCPTVNVMLITYNHANYIAQALQSVLDQEVNFPVVINVIDDCSTDGTQCILRKFKKEHPERISLYINEENIGFKVTQKNFYRGFKTLSGKYIAILEGDDYWTSSNKLQSQIDFLEGNPDFVACAHNVMKVYEDSSKESHIFLPPPEKETHDIEDLISISSYFHTTSLTYRHVLKDRVPREFSNKYSCDLFITIAHAQYGRIHFSPEVMSVYRSHPGGRFSNLSETQGWMFNIDGFRRYNRWLGYRYFKPFVKAIYRYAEYLLRHGKSEDGLTRSKRIKYAFLLVVYRAVSDCMENRSLVGLRPDRLFRGLFSLTRQRH